MIHSAEARDIIRERRSRARKRFYRYPCLCETCLPAEEAKPLTWQGKTFSELYPDAELPSFSELYG
jgi:hypothetical protein